MSGLEGVGAASAILSLIAVAKKLKGTMENIPQNQATYHDVTKNLVEITELFDNLIRERQGQVDASELYESLSYFTSQLETIYTKAAKVFIQREGVAKLKAQWTLMFKADDIKDSLLRVEGEMGKYMQLFMASTAIRTEINTREMQEMLKSIQSNMGDLSLIPAAPRAPKTSDQLQPQPNNPYGANYESPQKKVLSSTGTSTPAARLTFSNGLLMIADPNEPIASRLSRTSFRNVGHLETGKEAVIDIEAALAQSKSDRASQLEEIWHIKEALRWSEGALETRRGLAMAQPEKFKSYLALSLQNHCTLLNKSGDTGAALECILEAAEIRRELAKGPLAASKMEFANTLNLLSTCLSHEGRNAEALPPIEEVVAMNRECIRTGDTAFEAPLAHALDHLSHCLDQVGRSEESISPVLEAIEIRRRLVQNDAFAKADLAHSLTNFAARLRNVGRSAEALQWNQEAISIYREIVEVSPLCKTDFAKSLSSLGFGLKEAGRIHEALSYFQEAVRVSREHLLRDCEIRERPHLAWHAWNLSVCLNVAGRVREAILGLDEVVDMYRDLCDEGSPKYQENVDTALKLLIELRTSDRFRMP